MVKAQEEEQVVIQTLVRWYPFWLGTVFTFVVSTVSMRQIYIRARQRQVAKNQSQDDPGIYFGFWVVLTFTLWSLTIGGSMELIGSKQMTVRDGQVVAVFPDAAWVWRWDRRIAGAAIKSYASLEVAEKVNTNPITPNPEVRALVCVAELSIAGTPEDYMQYRGTDWARDANAKLRFLLFEFENRYHGQLTQFYNPEDREQQRRFQAMLYDFLAPHMNGQGVYLKSAYFRRPLHD